MTETNQHFVYNDPNTLKQNMAVLFNNPQHSDTTFIIGDSKLYAWSGLLSVASVKLGAIINSHYANCDDREIKLYNVKQVESFSILLKCVYGMPINFTQTSVPVLCEVYSLSVTYGLTHISEDLENYLLQMPSFQLDSVVVLLNTAIKHNMSGLYQRLLIFAYQNSDQLLKHASFRNLQYSVLIDLVKSDWFCSSEIEILKGILVWHTDMEIEKQKMKKSANKRNAGNVSEDVIENQDEERSNVADHDPDVVKSVETESDAEEECGKIEQLGLHGEDADSYTNNTKEMEAVTSEKIDKCIEIMESFSENILNSLIAHVRMSQMSALDLLRTAKMEQFEIYSCVLTNESIFSQSLLARKKYQVVINEPSNVSNVHVEDANVATTLNNVQEEGKNDAVVASSSVQPETKNHHVFLDTQGSLAFISIFPTQREHPYKVSKVFCGGDSDPSTQWTLILVWNRRHGPGPRVREVYVMFLTVACTSTSDARENWECTADCKLRWIIPSGEMKVIPDGNTFKPMRFTKSQPCHRIGEWEWNNTAKWRKKIGLYGQYDNFYLEVLNFKWFGSTNSLG
uniref:BTB/POZ domain-containing protein 9 n=1 Tax=Cacopsylla melanoneura TaxID=428564 RepID=A0A8D8WGR7_9HEMI